MYNIQTLNRKASEEFSKGNFNAAYNDFADDIQWNIVGDKIIKGKTNVIESCDKMVVEMDGSLLTNTTILTDDDHIAIEGKCDFYK